MWIEQSDLEPKCPGPMGPVHGDENVVRHIHTGNSNPFKAAFQKAELFRPDNEAYSNACGASHGASVDRVAGLTDNELRKRSEAQAGERHTSRGCMIANVAELRGIKIPDTDGQIVRVYDDARLDNSQHAVIRCSASRPDRNRLRDAIVKAFRHTIGSEA